MWRIMGFNITKKEPSVTPIAVHLPNDKTFYQYHRNNSSNTLSSLEHYFVRPLGPFSHNGAICLFEDLTYVEYYSLFRLSKYDHSRVHSENYYLERPNRDGTPPMHVILRSENYRHYARIKEIPNMRGELFYLRALLHHRPASSFSDARTVDGVQLETFQDAATALGLFRDQTEAEYILSESVHTLKTPSQLRVVFVHLLANNEILTPLHCWNTFCYDLCRDFTLRYPHTPQIAVDHGLESISHMLEEHGKRLSDYQLPEPHLLFGREVDHEIQKWAPFSAELASESDAAYRAFNAEQRLIYDEIIFAATQQQPLLLFVDGKAGVGKTFLINAICNKLRSLQLITLPTATSAHAAQLYAGGRTTHSTFKVCSPVFFPFQFTDISLKDPRKR